MNDRVVETQFVFDRHAATDVSVPTPFWCHSDGPVSNGPVRKDDRSMTSAVIYARVSSARQEEGRDDSPDGGAARARRAAGT